VLGTALAGDGLVGVAVSSFGLADLPPLRLGQMAFIAAYALVCCLGPNDLVKVVLTERLWTAAKRRPT
jgi:hypothetical protein